MDDPGCTVLCVLAVDRATRPMRLLLGIRRPDTNARHPGIVSLPTMRIPDAVGPQLRRLAGGPARGGLPSFHPVSAPVEQWGIPGAGHRLVPFLLESMLSRKLGADRLLEAGLLGGNCSLRMLAVDAVDDADGTGVTELTCLYTVVAEVTRGAEWLAGDTASYKFLQWITFDEFRESWRLRDAQYLFPHANPFEICIRGLCIRTGIELLREPAGNLL
jgi:hypothetical protein